MLFFVPVAIYVSISYQYIATYTCYCDFLHNNNNDDGNNNIINNNSAKILYGVTNNSITYALVT